ncbi:MAG: DNA polymerase III subunit gamma/tau [Archangium sp.]
MAQSARQGANPSSSASPNNGASAATAKLSESSAQTNAPVNRAPSNGASGGSFAERFAAQRGAAPAAQKFTPGVPQPRPPSADPEVTLVNRVLPGDVKLFEPEGSPGGCASGECLPPPPLVLEPDPEPEPEVVAPSAPARSLDDDRWRRAVEAVRNASPRHGKSLSYARFLGFVPEGVKIAFPENAAFHRAQIIGLSRSMIEGELAKSFGRPTKLIEDTSAAALQAAPKSIAEAETSDRNNRERDIEIKVKASPALMNILKHLGGSLEHITYLEPAQKVRIATADESDAGPPVD